MAQSAAESPEQVESALNLTTRRQLRKQFWWLGTTSHLELHAALLGMAAQVFDKREYRDLADRQLEWVMGSNPFGACLMTGEGMKHVYPHSRYVGLLNGGIVNGIAGSAVDEPILDTKFGSYSTDLCFGNCGLLGDPHSHRRTSASVSSRMTGLPFGALQVEGLRL